MQTDRMVDLIIKNTSPIPTVSQQTGTPTVAQQAHMHDLRKTEERKATKRFTPSAYNTKRTADSTTTSRRRRRKCNQKSLKKKIEQEKAKEDIWNAVQNISCGNNMFKKKNHNYLVVGWRGEKWKYARKDTIDTSKCKKVVYLHFVECLGTREEKGECLEC